MKSWESEEIYGIPKYSMGIPSCVGLPYGPKKTVNISVFIEDLFRICFCCFQATELILGVFFSHFHSAEPPFTLHVQQEAQPAARPAQDQGYQNLS